MKNGDVYDVGQTINGVSKFLLLDDKWHYYNKDMNRDYEYDQNDLKELILNDEDVIFIGNIFNHLPY